MKRSKQEARETAKHRQDRLDYQRFVTIVTQKVQLKSCRLIREGSLKRGVPKSLIIRGYSTLPYLPWYEAKKVQSLGWGSGK